MSSIPTRRELLGWLLAFTLLITFVTVLNPSVAAEGDSVAPTEEKIATEGVATEGLFAEWKTSTVFIATGENFPDALAAAAAAGAWNAPVLLVGQNSVPQVVIDELNRLEPDEIWIAGGTAVVSSGVEATLQGLAFGPTVIRREGQNRYETAVEITEVFFPSHSYDALSGYVSKSDVPDFSEGGVKLLDLDFEVPTAGILTINAGVEVYGGPDDIATCLLKIDGNPVTGSARDIELDGSGNSEENCTTQGGFENLGNGWYSIELWGYGNSSVQTVEAAMTVVWTDSGSFIDGP